MFLKCSHSGAIIGAWICRSASSRARDAAPAATTAAASRARSGSRSTTAGARRRTSRAPLATILTVDATRTIIARNDSPDIGFDRSINPYRGCEHGCIYCYARPSHAYLGLSPGLDFETRIFYKPQAASAACAGTAQARATPPNRWRSAATPTRTSRPNASSKITRSILEVLRDFRHPVTIVTKSALIQRDIDILAEMARQQLALVTVSVTTLDRDLRRRMEPRTATPERRIADDCRARQGRHPRRGVVGADDPGPQRQRDGGDPDAGARSRRRASPATRCCACRSN